MVQPNEGWLLHEDGRLGARFWFPARTAAGALVEKTAWGDRGAIRVHVFSGDRSEVYFEVSRFPPMTVAEGRALLVAQTEGRLEGMVHEPLKPATVAGLPGQAHDFRWPGFVRRACFTDGLGAAFRVIYDPRSATNMEILETLEWI